jgi:hypothetical protein
MARGLPAAALLLSVVLLTAGVASAGKKVTICHVPRGNPANAHTISVCEAAVSAHLHHGDVLGTCPRHCEGPGCCSSSADCDDGNACTVDSCRDGICANEPRDCAVADRCLAGFCAANGECATAPVSGDPLCNFCGDGLAQPLEDCDGQDLKGETCATVLGPGYEPAGLACNVSCHFDTSLCAPIDPGPD